MSEYDMRDDRELARLACDDQAAFDALYRRHVTSIYRFCYARTQNAADAEDVTAQTFLAALESLDAYRGRGTVLGWLFGIARHKCADIHRSRRNQVDTDWETAAPEDLVRDDSAPNPEQAAHHALILDCVERMLSQLSPERQEALQLRYYGGLELSDVARAMERSVAAVKMLISRGIADLRKRCLYA
jgi:RNA polymerase sigma-70 factor, ECF subfamily